MWKSAGWERDPAVRFQKKPDVYGADRAKTKAGDRIENDPFFSRVAAKDNSVGL